jgi:hypothetical protein
MLVGGTYLLTSSKGNTCSERNEMPPSVLRILLGGVNTTLRSLHYGGSLLVGCLPARIIGVAAKCGNNAPLPISNWA